MGAEVVAEPQKVSYSGIPLEDQGANRKRCSVGKH
ncbi:MAG: hypothetical protein JWP03_3008 [Phycisphaerales bacterium]|jgi:hypothetical protein|nr:hypothetical protein [Phycisphaerales bacterium]